MSWQEVERYLLPETPLSNGQATLDGINEAFAKSLDMRTSNRLNMEVDIEDESRSGSRSSTPASGDGARAGKNSFGRHARKDSNKSELGGHVLHIRLLNLC